MAENKNRAEAGEQKVVSPRGVGAGTEYVTDEAPNLPTADVDVTRDAPVIDRRLIELRDAEAKAQAERFSK